MKARPEARLRQYRLLTAGEPAPWFTLRCGDNPRYNFDTAAGRYLVLGFFGTAGDDHGRRMIALVNRLRDLFDDDRASFFGVSLDPGDERRLKDSLPGVRFFWDFGGEACRLYGALPIDAFAGEVSLLRQWVVLDPDLRIRAVLPSRPDGGDHRELAGLLEALPPIDHYPGLDVQAPILTLRDVFEPELCRRLVEMHRAGAPTESGVMTMVNGRTVGRINHQHKSRQDVTIDDPDLRAELQRRVVRRVFPELRKVCQFEVTRMERYIVACYDAEAGGHFGPHRDNTTGGTAHRRFAMSVNLNADYEGGEICFPEYGTGSFKMPPGGAVVFSCSLLHAVTPMTRGRRYVFLPFFYDESAAALRERNNDLLGDQVEPYQTALEGQADPDAGAPGV